jgi:tRNA(adenine34) deaminase
MVIHQYLPTESLKYIKSIKIVQVSLSYNVCMDHKKYLEKALEQAYLAKDRGDYPIGAVLVDSEGTIIASNGNKSFSSNDVSAHAEILCFKEAGACVSKKNTQEVTLYTTLEPCYGCAFFSTYTNIKRIVWALTDLYKGGIEDLKNLPKIDGIFDTIEFIAEPDIDSKHKSQKLMYEFHMARGSTETALKYKD